MDVNVEGDLNELKAGNGISIGDTKYEYAADLHAENAPLVDPATGKTVLIRAFNFQINPELKDFDIDKQELFNHHARQIQTLLWADGLQPMSDIPPRVIINIEKSVYNIFVACESRLSTVFADKPRALTQQLIHEA